MKHASFPDVSADFPLLKRRIDGRRIVYLDSTATALKPEAVITKEHEYYTKYCANIFRGIYRISEEATEEYENVRAGVARFIGCSNPEEIVFTRNASESINLVAYSWGIPFVKPGERIVSTVMEHHSNFVVWQQFAKRFGWDFAVWDITDAGILDMTLLETLVTKQTKLVALTAVSNVLGTVNPVAEIVKAVKTINPDCLVLVDAAQAAPHMKINVKDWDADFVVFSSHKMLGPTGIGVLWGKYELLESMMPYTYGGEMITEVYNDRSAFKKPPHKFESGTPHIAGVIGFGAAVKYLENLGMDSIREHEVDITRYALKALSGIDGLSVVGPSDAHLRGGVVAFTVTGVHAHDIAQILDEDNICIRSGNHCAMPLHVRLGIPATARASFYIYTRPADIDALSDGIKNAIRIFS